MTWRERPPSTGRPVHPLPGAGSADGRGPLRQRQVRPGRALVAWVLAVGLGAGSLAGCGGPASALERVQAAPGATESAGSARVTLTAELRGSGGAPPQPTVATGSYSFTSGGALSLSPAAGSELARPTEAVIKGSRFYLQLPSGLAARLGSRPWLSVEPTDQPKLSRTPLGSLGLVQSLSPDLLLAELRGVTGSPKVLGKGSAPGGLSYYRVAVDLAHAEQLASGDEKAALHQLREELGLQVIHGELRLDPQGRVRLLSLTFDLSHLATAAGPVSPGMTEIVTMELSDFGAPARFSVPDPAHVSNFRSMESAAHI